jgi:rfaE bifunctional protein nucleotidyltransferase chain/domain
MTQTKQKTLDELITIVKDARAEGKKVVLANGCFDLIHAGHVSYLESAKKIGDILVVALNSDVSVKLLKDERRPVIPEDQRVEILSAMEAVDYIVVFDDNTCDRILREIHPDYHAKGTDYQRDTVPERDTARDIGAETVIVGNEKENATKDIIAEIIQRYTKEE